MYRAMAYKGCPRATMPPGARPDAPPYPGIPNVDTLATFCHNSHNKRFAVPLGL